MKTKSFAPIIIFFLPFILLGCKKEIKNIERPEKIVSKRNVAYDIETYSKLAAMWKEYYEEFPSEDSYANWMYAARYANWPDYKSLLEEGVKKYPANPTLLYLKALIKNGGTADLESIRLLERAVELDPSFLDPWFGLAVDYMGTGDLEKSHNALQKLLNEGAISEEIMDYNYNVLSLLEKNAILITNGDNDTYPAWILTKIVKYRPDVVIVNRSLLNTEWYPIHLIKNENIPEFIDKNKLNSFRDGILQNLKDNKLKMPAAGPFSDSLIVKIINLSKETNRPIYIASTVFQTGIIKKFTEDGSKLGLATLINPSTPYSNQIKELVDTWLNKFRTGGLASWKLKYAKNYAAGKWLTLNYGYSIKMIVEPVLKYSPNNILPLFSWYKSYILDLLPEEKVEDINNTWCNLKGFKEISDWCNNK